MTYVDNLFPFTCLVRLKRSTSQLKRHRDSKLSWKRTNSSVNLYHLISARMATESNYFWIFVSWSGKLLLLNHCTNANFIYLEARILLIRLIYNVFTVKEGSQNNISCISGAAYKTLKQAEFENFPIWNDFGTWPRYLVFRTFPLLAPWGHNPICQDRRLRINRRAAQIPRAVLCASLPPQTSCYQLVTYIFPTRLCL